MKSWYYEVSVVDVLCARVFHKGPDLRTESELSSFCPRPKISLHPWPVAVITLRTIDSSIGEADEETGWGVGLRLTVESAGRSTEGAAPGFIFSFWSVSS